MEAVSLARSDSFDSVCAVIADALAGPGYCVLDDVLPVALTEALLHRVIELDRKDFERAGIGRELECHLNDFVRTDEVRWLRGAVPAEADFLQWMERLRLGLNRRLFLGLFDYECHFAHYPVGAYYKRHLDAFQGTTNRVVTTVFYLNPGWQTADGGMLSIFPPDQNAPSLEPLERVVPLAGTLVVFLSERFPHEVEAALRDRYSIAGWFRVNGSTSERVDPPR